MSYTKITYEDGATYEGSFNKNGLKHGIGKLKLPDGAMYEGKFMNGFYNGLGTLTLPEGSRYEGEFLHGKFHGFGIYSKSDGMRYEGRFQDGKVNGNGLVTHNAGLHNNFKSEGFFEGNKLVRREASSDSISHARRMALDSRRFKLNKGKVKSLQH